MDCAVLFNSSEAVCSSHVSRDHGAKVQFAVFMSQVVILMPGAFGVPVMGVAMSTAVSANRQALDGGGAKGRLL